MRSSRSKRAELNVFEDEHATHRNYGGFSSFFGKPRHNKVPAPHAGTTELERSITESKFETAKPTVQQRKTSVVSRHYKSMSRSMSDLGALISRTDLADTLHDTAPEGLNAKSPGSQATSPEQSPQKRNPHKRVEHYPFPIETITHQGWLNKKTSRRDVAMKLNRVLLRESKIYAYKPPVDLQIRAFDIHASPQSSSSAQNLSEMRLAPHSNLHPSDFSTALKSLFFNTTSSGDAPVFQESCLLHDHKASQRRTPFLLLFIPPSKLILCKKSIRQRSHHDSPSKNQNLIPSSTPTQIEGQGISRQEECWDLEASLDLGSVELSKDSTGREEYLLVIIGSQRRTFASDGQLLSLFLENCEKSQKKHLLEARPSTAPGTMGLDLVADHEAVENDGLELFKVRQIVRDSSNTIVRGTVTGLCRQLLLDKSDPNDPTTLGYVLLHTIGLWADAEIIVRELCEQLRILSDPATRERPGRIARVLLSAAPSLLLSSRNIEALLSLVEFESEPYQSSLKEELWACRSRLLSIITMERAATVFEAESNAAATSLTEYETLSDTALHAESILAIPADLFASQLHVFHLYYLKQWNPADDKSLFFSLGPYGAARNPLVFSSHRMHFLTYTIMSHLLCIDSQPISSHRRAAICSQWIVIGIMLKRFGDMTGWLATLMALCAPSVIRLREMWSLVEARLRIVVEKEWSPVMRDLFRRNLSSTNSQNISAHVLAPDVVGAAISIEETVPFYGDLCDALSNIKAKLRISVHGHPSIDVGTLRTGMDILNVALESYQHFKEEAHFKMEDFNSDSPAVAVKAFQDCFKQLNSMPSDIHDVCSATLLELSLQCELPRDNDLVSAKSSRPLPDIDFKSGAYLALLFNDPLPSYRLFDAADLMEVNDSLRRPKLATQANYKHTTSNATGAPLRRLNSFPPTQKPIAYTTGHLQLDQTTRSRAAASVSEWKMLKHVKEFTGVEDRLLASSDGNLILKDSENDAETAKKRPQSILVDGRIRNSQLSRRDSLVLQGNAVFEQDDDLVIRPQRPTKRRNGSRDLVVKAATFDMMLNLLILNINDLRGLELHAINTGQIVDSHNINLDRPEFVRNFLMSYRSFCTPEVLLRELTSRLQDALSASSTEAVSGSRFPIWPLKVTEALLVIDWVSAELLYTGIFEVISCWLSLAPTDFTALPNLLALLDRFLVVAEVQIARFDEVGNPQESPSPCKHLCTSHLTRVRRQVLRVLHKPQSWSLLSDIEHTWEIYEPFSLARVTGSEDVAHMLDDINKITECVLRGITLEDWICLYEVLEVQATDARGFFKNITELIALDQEVEIHDSLWLLETTTSEGSPRTLLEKLPISIRKLVQLRFSITSWTISQITDPSINLDVRVSKMRILWQALGSSASAMSPLDIQSPGTELEPPKTQIVPSFVAGAISAGLVSPQSRTFSYSWHRVKQSSGKHESISKLQDLMIKDDTTHRDKLLIPCLAWIVDRMIEIACYIPDTFIDNAKLLNFDKRRYLLNLLSNLDLIGGAGMQETVLDDIDNPFLFLLASPLRQFDWKLIRSTAYRENQLARNVRLPKPFSNLVQSEHDKARRDVKQRELIERHIREHDRLMARRRQDMDKVAEQSKRIQSRSRYGMNSLLRAVRPISVAISGSWAPEKGSVVNRIISVADLPLDCSISRGTRPALTIDLVNAVISVHNREQNMLRIRSEDGLETYFQAPSQQECVSWVQKLTVASIDGTKKRKTAMREDARLAAIEETPQFSFRNSFIDNTTTAVYGVDLPLLIQRDKSSIPHIAVTLIEEIEKRGLEEVGIYRISGSLSTVVALKRASDSGIDVDLSESQWSDVNVIAGAFKLWLRELPEPLMTYTLYSQFLDTLELEDQNIKAVALKKLVHQLPVPNFSMLKRLIEHLERITDYEATNHMYAHNLAIVFGPNILQAEPSPDSFAASMNDLGKVQTIIRSLILQCHWIFTLEEDTEDSLGLSKLPIETKNIN